MTQVASQSNVQQKVSKGVIKMRFPPSVNFLVIGNV